MPEVSTARRILNLADRATNTLSRVLVFPAAVVLVAVSIMITTSVVVRETPIPWQWTFVDEYSGYFLVLMIYFALAYTLRTGGHITVDVVVRHLHPRLRVTFDVFLTALALAIVSFMMERSLGQVAYALDRDARSLFQSHTPLWIPNIFVFIGLLPFGIALLLHGIHAIIAAVTGNVEEAETAPEQPPAI